MLSLLKVTLGLIDRQKTRNLYLFQGSNPECYTDSSQFVWESDSFQVTCSVNYSGDWNPTIGCYGSQHENMSYINNYDNSTNFLYTSNIATTMDMDGSMLTCNIHFQKQNVADLDYKQTWNVTQIDIACKLFYNYLAVKSKNYTFLGKIVEPNYMLLIFKL